MKKENEKKNYYYLVKQTVLGLEKYFVYFIVLKEIFLLLNVFIPYLYKVFVDDVLVGRRHELISKVFIGYVICYICVSVCKITIAKVNNNTTTHVKLIISKKILEKLISSNLKQTDNIEFMDYKKRYSEDTDTICRFVLEQVFEQRIQVITCLIYFFLLCKINFLFSIMCLVFIPISFAITEWRSRKFLVLYEEDYNKRVNLERFSFQTFEYWKEIKSLSIEEVQCNEFRDEVDRYGNFRVKLNKYNYFNSFIESLQSTILLNINMYLIGAIFVLKGYITIGGLLVFIQYFGVFYNAVSSVQSNKVEYKKMLPALKRIFELLEDEEVKALPKLILDKKKLDISLINVCFAYKKREILKNISLEINQGERVVIIGESGCGKSTLLKLFLNMYKPQRGEFRINNKRVCQYQVENYYDCFSVVQQDPILFNMSIWDNFRLVKQDLKQEEVEIACSKVGILEYINTLKNRFNTVIGQNGCNLSRGQRQRLVIARAILIDAPVMIFDEVTASLDSESEQFIMKCIFNMPKEKTIIMVSHDLKLVTMFDKVICIANGSIYAYGKHDFLISSNEKYASLFLDKYSD